MMELTQDTTHGERGVQAPIPVFLSDRQGQYLPGFGSGSADHHRGATGRLRRLPTSTKCSTTGFAKYGPTIARHRVQHRAAAEAEVWS